MAEARGPVSGRRASRKDHLILVITGTEKFQFTRLVDAVDELAGSGDLGEEFFVQLGVTPRAPRHARFERFLSFDRVLEEIRRASVVVTHAGAGTTLACIQQGKHPVLVPRLARHGEVIDDHQVPFAEELSGARLATVVHDLGGLRAAIAAARSKSARDVTVGRPGELTSWLEGFWQELVRRSRPPR